MGQKIPNIRRHPGEPKNYCPVPTPEFSRQAPQAKYLEDSLVSDVSL